MSDLIENTTSVSANVDNMALWNSVCKTDPSHTKPAKIGGMTITAISPQYQIRTATEQFGPYGSSWGLKNISRDFSLLDQLNLVMFSAIFFYPGGEFEISTSHKIYMDRNNTIVDTDFCKKMETDLLTKALSKIGFNADVFMGRYDDVKYVNELKEEFSRPKTISQQQQEQLISLMESHGMAVNQFLNSWTLASLAELHASNYQNAVNWINSTAQAQQEQQQTEETEQQEQTEQFDRTAYLASKEKKQFNRNRTLSPEQIAANKKDKQPGQQQDNDKPENQHQADAEEVIERFIAGAKKESQKRENSRQRLQNESERIQAHVSKQAGYKVITVYQADQLRKVIKQAGMNETDFCKTAKVKQLGYLNADKFEGAVTWLQKLASNDQERRIRSC